VVLERLAEPGNLAEPGGELFKLGDFAQVKVIIQVSELELSALRVGLPAQVSLDAFPKAQFPGRITRISPVADPTARLVPIEIMIPNPQRRIGSGLLARVSFGESEVQTTVVPESALQLGGRARSQSPPTPTDDPEERTTGQIYVIAPSPASETVQARNVTLGSRRDGQVEVRSGIQPGERVVIRSSKPLKSGDPVRLSILSEGRNSQDRPIGKP
jgi:RND family efflux transporter MFP subunit